jgi:hypothetical protein
LARIEQAKAKLATKEQEIKALEDSLVTSNRGPGVVPPVKGMTRSEARAAIQAAQLKGFVKYAGAKPSSNEDRDQMIVTDQDPAGGTQLKAGEGRVIVTLAAKEPASDKPDEPVVESQPVPKDGRYLVTMPNGQEVGTIDWTNRTDGSAELRLVFTDMVANAVMQFAGLTNDTTLQAAPSKEENAYLVGQDFHDFMEKLCTGGSVTGTDFTLLSKFRLIIGNDGSNGLVIDVEGSFRSTSTDKDGNQTSKTFTYGKSAERFQLVGKPIQ